MAITLRETHDITDADLLELSRLNPGYQLERDNEGRLVVTSTGGESGRRAAEVTRQLSNWSRARRAGPVFDSSTGFRLPDGSVRSPDAAWVSSDRWRALTTDAREAYPPLCPDANFEVRSRTASLDELRAKMASYIENGAVIAILIDPYHRIAEVFRPAGVATVPYGEIPLDPQLEGFTLDLRTLDA